MSICNKAGIESSFSGVIFICLCMCEGLQLHVHVLVSVSCVFWVFLVVELIRESVWIFSKPEIHNVLISLQVQELC